MYTGMRIWIFLTYVALVRSIHLEQVYTENECFSKRISLNCSTDQVIALKQVVVGTKPSEYQCLNMHRQIKNESACCYKGPEDCTKEYKNQVDDYYTYRYHRDCTGLDRCQNIEVQFVRFTSCNSSVYGDDSTYMSIDYYCIPDSRIGMISNASLDNGNTGEALYILGQQYPHNISIGHTNCSIETDSGGIIVYVVHLNFAMDNQRNTCQQNIVLTYLNGNCWTIDCQNNNNYTITKFHTSSSNYLTIDFENRQLDTGQMWFGFSHFTSHSQVPLAVSSVISKCTFYILLYQIASESGSLVISCPSKPPSIKTYLTTLIPSDTGQSKGKSSTVLLVGAVIGGILALVLVSSFAVFIFCYYKNKKKRKVNPDEKHQDATIIEKIPPEPINDDVMTSHGTPIVSVAPLVTSAERNNRLPPLLDNSTGSQVPPTDDTAPEKKHKKKNKRKHKKKKSRIEIDDNPETV